jgi:nucleotide-binding universal stress UspA family protein
MNGHNGFQILVPTDFSPDADRALAEAVQLAQPLGAIIDLVHVQEPPAYGPFDGKTFDTSDAMRRHLSAELEQRLQRVREAGLEGRATPLRGWPAAEIVKRAREGNANLIVLGARGRSSSMSTRLGAVVDDVVRHAASPVLVVPTLH